MPNHNYFTTYIPGSEAIISVLQGQLGSQLEKLDYIEKTIFRAALSNYVANFSGYDEDEIEDNLIDTAIEGAAMVWSVWDNERLVEAIRMCQTLHRDDIEALIDSISSQIRGKIYAPQN